MATARLVASAYQLSNTSYLSISNPTNMYTNIDSTTMATVNHNRAATTAYYVYVRGFNFDSIPDGATINSAVLKVKAYVSGAGSYTPALYNGTTSIGVSLNGTIGTSATTRTVDITSNYSTYKGYGSNFGVRFQLNRSSRNTASYLYIYGLEILVDYTEAVPRTITASATGCTITPSGTTIVNEGDSFELIIDAESAPTVIDNGNDASANVTQRANTGSLDAVIAAYTTSGSISGTYYQNAVGKGYDAASTTNNCYCSTSGSTAYISYTFDLSSIPSNATIESVGCKIKGHAESTSNSSRKSDCQLYAGSTAKGTVSGFTSTTDYVLELDCGTWTRSELDNLSLRFTIGYYGGNISGATLSVVYSLPGNGYVYVYTISSVTVDHTIVVSVATSSVPVLKIKSGGTYVAVTKVYKKVNGSWVEQSDLENLFDTNTNYVCAT